MSNLTQKRVISYIDGFNFYYGLKNAGSKWKKFYWIDITKFCKSFLKEDEELECVKYFTARPLNNVGKRERQNILMKVNKKLHGDQFKIYYGKYTQKTITCLATCKEEFELFEEKQTDVNIAITIIEDYITNKCDKTIMISTDSDLLPPLRSIKKLEQSLSKNHKIEILFPPDRYSSDIMNSGFNVKQLKKYKNRFNWALLPFKVKLPDSEEVEIPLRWKMYFESN